MTTGEADQPRFWTSALNEEVLGKGAQTQIGFYDSTLRDGEQGTGVIFNPEDKVRIAHAIDELGIPRIEASFPRVSPRDEEAIRLLVQENLNAELWGFGRAMPADVDLLLELGLRASVIEAPVSHLKLEAFGVAPEKMLGRIRDAVKLATESDMKVCFFGVDGSRARMDHLQASYEVALEAGAQEIALVDTIGVLAPEACAHLVTQARSWVGPDVPIHWHGHNDFGLCTAGSVAAVQAGATWVQGTINGVGERAGNMNIAEVALALEGLYGYTTGIELDRLRATSELVAELSGFPYEPWKPVVGDNLFVRESGAIAMQFHDPEAVEPYPSQLVGAQRRIVLGKGSGLASIKIKGEDLGLDIEDLDHAELLAQVKVLSESKRALVSDEEFIEIIERARSVAVAG